MKAHESRFAVGKISVLRLLAINITIAMALATIQTSSYAAERIAVASLIGNKINIVRAGSQTGTMLDPNDKASISLPDPGLDGDIMLEVDSVIKKQCTSCTTSLLRVKATDSPEDDEKLLPGILGAAQKAGADKLVVLTKYKDAARLKFADGSTFGQGKLVGIGFYLDKSSRTQSSTTQERSEGFVAPYVYFKLTIIDVKTGDVRMSQGLTTSNAVPTAFSADFDPWNALPAERKVPALMSLINAELVRVMNLRQIGIAN